MVNCRYTGFIQQAPGKSFSLRILENSFDCVVATREVNIIVSRFIALESKLL